MICENCNNEFTNINGLKFCPYCGEKIDTENIIETSIVEKGHQNTSTMPVITKKDIRKYSRDKFFAYFKNITIHKKILNHKKIIIPIIVLLVLITAGAFAYTSLTVKAVNETRIKEDLLGKVVTLPKGTIIKIDKSNMKDFSISSRSTDKSTDSMKVTLTLNNGVVEAKTLLSVVYSYQGKNKWKANDAIVFKRLISIIPVVGMDQKKFLAEIKKLNVTIADIPIALGGQDVKNIGITLRTPDLKNGVEEILVATSIDSGFLSMTGKIKCKLVFDNEVWSINSVEQNSAEDFKLGLSPNISEDNIIQTIRKQGFNETLSYSDFFGGKGFKLKDNFTKSIKISSKKFDAQNGTLNVTAKRENTAGEIKTALSTNYFLSVSFSNISLLNGAKTTIDSATINNVPTQVIMPSITNAEIEGSNLLFWWSNNHKVTEEEAKTFKVSEMLSKKGYQNIKYVYGKISYAGKKKNDESLVAIYFLVYDDASGYNWKLDRIIGEDSPNYNSYSKEFINK